MKKILLPIAAISLALLAGACGNTSKRTAQPAPGDTTKTDITASTPTPPTEEAPVDQSAGYQVIEALSKIYSDHPNTTGGFIGNERCPSFLEGMYFDGGTLVFQVRGDTAQARRTLEQAAGSSAFQLEQMKEGTYSEAQLKYIMNEINRRYDALPQNSLLRKNMNMWGTTAHHIHVQFIQNTPEARREFREKISDSPAIRFEGPEQPEVNETVGITETHGISLHPEYSVYSTRSDTASFLLINRSNRELMCGEHYFITYEDEQGTWRTLPINTFAVDIGYLVPPGDHHRFVAHLYPDIHRNKPGRYRFFYGARINETGRELNMMTEFRLTDNEQEVKQAVQLYPPSIDAPKTITEIIYIPPTGDREISTEALPKDTGLIGIHPVMLSSEVDNVGPDSIYQVVEEMPEFPGGMSALMEYIKTNIRYPETSRKNGVQGRVIVQFVVTKDGSIEQARVVRNINLELDEEALRVIRSMPRWKPGKQRGRIVKVKFTVPVTFRLDT